MLAQSHYTFLTKMYSSHGSSTNKECSTPLSLFPEVPGLPPFKKLPIHVRLTFLDTVYETEHLEVSTRQVLLPFTGTLIYPNYGAKLLISRTTSRIDHG